MFKSLHLIDLRNNNRSIDDLFDYLLSSNDFSDSVMNRDDLLDKFFYFFVFSSDIRNFLDDLLDFSVHNDLFLNLHDLIRLGLNCVLNYDFFHNCWNLNNFLDSFSHRHKLLYNAVNWNRNFNWDNNLFFNLDYLRDLHLIIYDFLNRDVSGYFLDNLNDLLDKISIIHNSFLHCLKLNHLIDDFFNDSVDLNVDILFDLDFFDSFLDNRNLHNFLNFFNSFFNNDFWNHSFNYLRYLNDFLDDSRYHNHFFNNFFDFNYFGYLDHFLDNLFNRHFDFFDSVNMPQNFHYLFFNVFDGFRYLDVVINNLFHLNSFRLANNNRVSYLNYHWNLSLDYLYDRLFNNLLYCHYSLVNDGDLYYALDLFRHFSVVLDNSCDLFDHLFNSFDLNDLLDNNLNRVGLFNCIGNLNNLLDDLRNLNNSLLSLNNNNRLFNDTVDRDVSNLNMIFHLFSSHHIYFPHNFLDNLLNLDYFWYSDNLFDYFLNINWNLDDLLYNLFNRDYFFFVDDDFLDFRFNVIDDLSYSNRFFDFNNLFYDLFDLVHLRNLSNNFDYSVLYSGYFNCSLNYFLD